MNILILGNPGSGRHTFLTLLYAAQVQYSYSSKGKFRHFLDPQALSKINDMYNSLILGITPSDQAKDQLNDLSFSYSSTSSIFDRLHLRKTGSEQNHINIEYNIPQFPLNDPDNNKVSSIKSNYENKMNGGTIFLIDLTQTDEMVESLSRFIIDYRDANNQMIPPCIIFSKFDAVHQDSKLSTSFTDLRQQAPNSVMRFVYGEKILKKQFRTIYNVLQDANIPSEARYFFSYLRMESDSDGNSVPSLKSRKKGGYELDFPVREYYGLLNVITGLKRING